jgi:Macrocin-O-methyltransferase (TylF)
VNFEESVALAKSRSDCHPDNIDSLIQIVNELDSVPGSIAECGCYRCGATIAMAAAAPSKMVFAFDLFGGLPYGDGAGFENFGTTDFKEILNVAGQFPNIAFFKGRHEETVPRFAAHFRSPLSLIFMDSDFYESHKVCLTQLWPILSSGGKVIFHDWVFLGVQQAIRETIPTDEIRESGIVPSSPNMGYITKK